MLLYGDACRVSTDPIAKASYFFNLIQVSSRHTFFAVILVQEETNTQLPTERKRDEIVAVVVANYKPGAR